MTTPNIPGTRFQYRFALYCSQIGPGCLDARAVPVIPAERDRVLCADSRTPARPSPRHSGMTRSDQ